MDISKITLPSGQTYNIKDAVARTAVSAGLNYVKVETLPTASADTVGKIYLVSHNHATGDVYDEYITVETSGNYAWEKLGNTDINLSGYSKDTHTHSVTSNVAVGAHSYTPQGSNAASSVSFTGGTNDVVLGEGTTFTNSASGVSGSATVTGTNAASSVTFDTTTAGTTASAITAMGASTVPAYTLGNATTKHITASASGTAVSTVTKYVASSANGGGSVTAGSDASLSTGSQASWSASVNESTETLSFSFTPNTLQTLTGGKATVVTLPTFASQTIATGVSAQPSITLADTATTGGVVVVTAQGSLSTSGTNSVTFGTPTKATVLTSSVTATAAAQKWSQATGTISGTAAAQSITVGTNDKVTAITGIGTATAAAQAFTGTAATLSHSVTNNAVTSGSANA